LNYELNITKRPGFLHAIVTGENTAETNRGYLEELLGRCVAQGCDSVLIEERLGGQRLWPSQIFEIASQMTEKARGWVRVVAFVDVNAQDQWNTKFGENVAVNRGLNVSVFATVAAAEAWLLRQLKETTEPHASY
jgi:hypothetical protein